MPLVFVHGVANRLGPGYEQGKATRDALFRRFLLANHKRSDGKTISVENPYWGDLGGKLAWNGASLPLEEFEALGSDTSTLYDLYATSAPATLPETADRAVLTVARESLPDAVDLLWGAGALSVSADAEADADALAALAVKARAYALAHERPGWVEEVGDDQSFVTRLQQELDADDGSAGAIPGAEQPEWESLGIDSAWQALRRGVAQLNAAVAGTVGKKVSDVVRPPAVARLAEFLGDAFVYLHDQEAADGIGKLVEGALRTAAGMAQEGDPLVVVAHSMGGNITYDLFTSRCADVDVDLYVTAGTQVGFFEELKLFRNSDRTIPGSDPSRKVPRPANVKRWINVFDQSDLLGFEAGSVIDDVEDFSYRTGSLLKAHSQYFVQPGFHERLARRAAMPTP